MVAMDPDGAATQAGVEVGDQLLDLTWILSEAPGELASATDARASERVTATGAPLRPPPGVEYKTVPFTAPDEIRTMISYGLPLRPQLLRAGEMHALTIIPAPPDAAPSDDTIDAAGAPEQDF